MAQEPKRRRVVAFPPPAATRPAPDAPNALAPRVVAGDGGEPPSHLVAFASWAGAQGAALHPRARIAWLGNYATALCVILFASPLSTVGRVLKERSAASIYAPSAVCQAVNGALWTAYGLFGIGDVYVWGPNATGLGLALLMLALKLVFPGPRSKVA